MCENNQIELIQQLIVDRNFNPKLELVAKFILGPLDAVIDHKVYSDNLVAHELVDIYKKRLVNLSTQEVEFGGFSETISSLDEGAKPAIMLTMDTDELHISILLDSVNRIVGVVYVEQQFQTVQKT